MGNAPIPLIFVALPWICSTQSVCFLFWGAQNWIQECRCGLSVQRARITSLHFWAIFFFTMKNMAAFSTRMHCCLMIRLLSTKSPECSADLPSHWLVSSLSRCLRLFLPTCRTSNFPLPVSLQPVQFSTPSNSGCQQNHLAYQTFLFGGQKYNILIFFFIWWFPFILFVEVLMSN